jgi:ubiquinone/menaquinone biosynthesis C-methylase UbiE
MVNKTEDKPTWDGIWQEMGDTVTYKDVFHLLDEIKLEYLLPLLPSPGKNVKTIEVGCGSARLSCFLASNNYHTTCLDYSEHALKVARKNYHLMQNEGEFVLADVHQIPFDDDLFDVVISTGLLEHFEDPLLVVKEMVRIIKPGGLFYSDIVPHKFSLLRSYEILLEKVGFQKKEHFYERKMNSQDIKEMLISANLDDIHVFAAGVFPPPLPLSERIKGLKKLEYQYLSRLKQFFKAWDNTIFADVLGFYYFVSARKPCPI